MDVTSAHLDVTGPRQPAFGQPAINWNDNDDGSEELAKRGDNFGHPVGKSAFTHQALLWNYELDLILSSCLTLQTSRASLLC